MSQNSEDLFQLTAEEKQALAANRVSPFFYHGKPLSDEYLKFVQDYNELINHRPRETKLPLNFKWLL